MKWLYLPKKLYFKPGSMEVALKELDEVYGVKRAFIITSGAARKGGAYTGVNAWVAGRGIRTCEFYVTEDKATEAEAKTGIQKMHEFQPEAVIAVGGEAAVTTAKLMIREYAQNPLFVTVTAGPEMGAGCSLISTYVDLQGKVAEIAGYAFLPEIAVIDADYYSGLSDEDIKASAARTKELASAVIEAETDSDFIQAFAKDALLLVESNLEAALGAGENARRAKEHLGNANVLAYIANGNAFL